MTKNELASLLADNEYSVRRRITPRSYWYNAWMRKTKAELEAAVIRQNLAPVCVPYHHGEYVNLTRDGETEPVMVEVNHGSGRIEVRYLNSETRLVVRANELSRD